MGRKRKRGRPKGSKNKKKTSKSAGGWYPGKPGRIPNYIKWGGPKRRGRPPGIHTKWSKTKKKATKKKQKGPGRPPGIHTKWGRGKKTKIPDMFLSMAPKRRRKVERESVGGQNGIIISSMIP